MLTAKSLEETLCYYHIYILSGTDYLGFLFTEDQRLYDRCILLHTTLIPYREFDRVLGIRDIDEYIRYGGTMSFSYTIRCPNTSSLILINKLQRHGGEQSESEHEKQQVHPIANDVILRAFIGGNIVSFGSLFL